MNHFLYIFKALILNLLFLLSFKVFSEKISFNILQLNDVYEPIPVLGGTRGGLSRVATIRKELIAQNPYTFTILAGDFLSPSPMNTVTFQGKKLAGKHMVDIFNNLGLNFATFGNHEFDLEETELLERIQESKFTWFTSNVFDAKGKRWPKVQSEIVLDIKGKSESIKVGLFAVTITKYALPFISYKNVLAAAAESINLLKAQKVDILIAVTHLPLPEDIELLEHFPEIDLAIGGHDHENLLIRRGAHSRAIVKADANAKSVYVHRFDYETQTKKLNMDHIFKVIDDDIPDDKEMEKVIIDWKNIAFHYFKQGGIDPSLNVGITDVDLDGRREYFRFKPNNLSSFLTHCLLKEGPGIDGALFNVGIVRIDDMIKSGSMVSQYDFLRLMPYPEKVFIVKISGSYLKHTLAMGEKSIGKGGFLHFINLEKNSENLWLLKNQLIKDEKSYRIAMNSYMAKSLENRLPSKRDKGDKIEVVEKKNLFLKSLITCMNKP